MTISSIIMKEVSQNTPVYELESIREGDAIKYRNGKCGIVVKIQVVCVKGLKKFFYKLQNEGTIFIGK